MWLLSLRQPFWTFQSHSKYKLKSSWWLTGPFVIGPLRPMTSSLTGPQCNCLHPTGLLAAPGSTSGPLHLLFPLSSVLGGATSLTFCLYEKMTFSLGSSMTILVKISFPNLLFASQHLLLLNTLYLLILFSVWLPTATYIPRGQGHLSILFTAAFLASWIVPAAW